MRFRACSVPLYRYNRGWWSVLSKASIAFEAVSVSLNLATTAVGADPSGSKVRLIESNSSGNFLRTAQGARNQR